MRLAHVAVSFQKDSCQKKPPHHICHVVSITTQEPLQEARKLCWAPGLQPALEFLFLFIALRSTFPRDPTRKSLLIGRKKLFISWRCQLPGPGLRLFLSRLSTSLASCGSFSTSSAIMWQPLWPRRCSWARGDEVLGLNFKDSLTFGSARQTSDSFFMALT